MDKNNLLSHEALNDLWFNHFVKNIHANLFPQKQVYMVSYDVNSKETFEEWKDDPNFIEDVIL